MNHAIQDKSFHFTVRIVNLCRYLQTGQKICLNQAIASLRN